MIFIIGPIIVFIALVIIAVRYDSIIPPVYGKLKKIQKLLSPIISLIRSFLEPYDKRTIGEMITISFCLPALFYKLIILMIGFPELNELQKVYTPEIVKVYETGRGGRYVSYLTFSTTQGDTISYSDERPKYDLLKNSWKNYSDITMWFSESDERDNIFQICNGENVIISYDEICMSKRKEIIFKLLMIFSFSLLTGPFLYLKIKAKMAISADERKQAPE